MTNRMLMFEIYLTMRRGNTEGWRCERCKAGFWGDAEHGCVPCICHEDGGALSNVCDSQTGQCVCTERYTGHQCNECDVSVQAKKGQQR